MNKYKVMIEFIKMIQNSLADLFDSGFVSVHDSTRIELNEFSKMAEVYGLPFAHENLKRLFEDFSNKRHQFQNDYHETMQVYCHLKDYLRLCLQRMEILQLKEKMKNEKPEGTLY